MFHRASLLSHAAPMRMKVLAKESLTQEKSAFTLIELLVVIAVIAVLAALLLPALANAKQQGNIAKCMSNLRQVGIGFTLFVDDNDDRYPPAGMTGNFV